MNDLLLQTKARLKELDLEPKRSLGQNFLISQEVVDRIVETVKALDPGHLIEVGPGVGALTTSLSEVGCPLLLIELDQRLAEFWRREQQEVIENDVLKVEWERLTLAAPAVVVSNLPYQVSTHLVVERCFGPAVVSHMVLMFQKEVAERLMARPHTKSYGLLSVMVQTHWQLTRLLEAGPRQFWPAPKVASQVVVLARRSSPVSGDERAFLSFLKVSFAQRRKFLSKNLLALPPSFKIHQGGLERAFATVGLDAKVRAEALRPEQFVTLFKSLRA